MNSTSIDAYAVRIRFVTIINDYQYDYCWGRIGNDSTRWNFACRLKGESRIHATSFYVGPWQNRCLFKGLSHAIQHHFVHRRAPYPVERTLLVTGILEAAMRARAKKGEKRLDTPHLEFDYAPRDFRDLREMGATWKIITESTPQPRGIDRLGR